MENKEKQKSSVKLIAVPFLTELINFHDKKTPGKSDIIYQFLKKASIQNINANASKHM